MKNMAQYPPLLTFPFVLMHGRPFPTLVAILLLLAGRLRFHPVTNRTGLLLLQPLVHTMAKRKRTTRRRENTSCPS